MTESKVVIRAGIPGMQDPEDQNEHHYPAGTSDFVKLLREQDFTVLYEHDKSERTLVSHKAFDVWLPILDFTANVVANVPANIVSTLILNYFRAMKQRPEDSTLHVKYLMRDKKGTVVEFEANGPGADVLQAIERFDSNARK